MNGLSLSRIHKEFAASGPVIADLSADFGPGDFVALLGPSGCGKSTLLRIAAGLEDADHGEVLPRPKTLRRGFVFQDAHLMPWASAVDNVALPLRLAGQSAQASRAPAAEQLARVGLAEAGHKLPHQLSGGMRMRTSLARALVGEPELLLLDEPFAALDESTRFRLQEDLRRLWAERSLQILFVTHSVAEAVFLANRIIVLSPRPARIIGDLRVELPHVRDASLRLSEVLLGQVQRVTRTLAAAEL